MAKTFDDLKLNFIYLHELWWLTKSIKTRCEKLFKETPLPDHGYFLSVDYNIHSLINEILSDAANVKKLIALPSKKTNNESTRQFNVHIERSRFLQDKIKGVKISEINSVKVRNTLQHFDEYLDEANIDISEGKLKAHPMAAYNFIMSHWEAIEPRPYPIRLYICAEKTFYNMKASVNLDRIYKEATNINEAIEASIAREYGDEPGGILFNIT